MCRRLIFLVLAGSLLASPLLAASLRDQAGVARRAGDFVLAEQLFRQAFQTEPGHAGLSIDLATVMVDQRHYARARQQLDQHRARFGESEAYWLTRAYLHDRQGEFFNSLTCYDNALRLNPHSEVALRQRIHTIDTLGMPDQAWALAEANPQVMREEDWLRLHADSAAYAVRIAGMDEPDRVLRGQRVQAAIRRCDAAITFILAHFPDRQAALQQTRMDRMLVWGLDNRHQWVLDEYAALEAERAVLRDDVRVAAAQSALHLEQPRRAVAMLQPLLARGTKDANARTLMFYAQLESEDYAAAQRTVDALVRDEPAWRHGQSPRVMGRNWNRVDADDNRLMLAAWGNTLDAAQAGMEDYQGRAPFNPHLRAALAGIYQLRGWPRQAESLNRDVLQYAPDHYAAQAGLVGSRMAVHDFPEAGRLTRTLADDYPELKSTESLLEDWAIHNMQELSMTFSLGRSNGDEEQGNDGGVNGSRDLEGELWWYSRPLYDQHRAFVHAVSRTGTFDEGKGQIDRVGAGWEQRDQFDGRAYRNTVEVNRNVASDADYGFSLTTDWQLDDHWSVQGALDTFSPHLPVRAYNDGVTAHSLDGGVRYRVDEGEYYRAGLTWVDFSDGNRRWMFGAEGYQVVWSNPHHQWAVLESLYSSTNTESDVIYFSPERDLELGLAAEYQGILRRHYDFEFRHVLLVGAGVYEQEGYGTKPVAQLQYRHNWKRDKALEWFYGVGFNLHPYDGEQERREALFGGLTWHFE